MDKFKLYLKIFQKKLQYFLFNLKDKLDIDKARKIFILLQKKLSLKLQIIIFLGVLIVIALLFKFATSSNIQLIKREEIKIEQNKINNQLERIEKETELLKIINLDSKLVLLQKNLKLIRSKIDLFVLINNRHPNKKEILKILNPIPRENFTNSKELNFKQTFKGGWHYNLKYGTFNINSKSLINNIRLDNY